MSRTRKAQVLKNCHRKPKGRRQILSACEEAVPPRKRSVPPSDWEDLPLDKQAVQIWNLSYSLKRDGLNKEQVLQKLKRRFKPEDLLYVLRRIFR